MSDKKFVKKVEKQYKTPEYWNMDRRLKSADL